MINIYKPFFLALIFLLGFWAGANQELAKTLMNQGYETSIHFINGDYRKCPNDSICVKKEILTASPSPSGSANR